MELNLDVATWIYQQRNDVSLNLDVFVPYFESIKSKNKNYIGRMLEIKCPKSRVITGFIPEVYRAQIQGQLEVCDLEYCDFLECEIKVYNSKEDFIEDSLVIKNDDGTETIDYRKTKAGNEKGAIFEIQNSQTKGYTYKYNYESLCSLDAIDAWEDPLFDLVIDSEHQTRWHCILVLK